MTFATGTKTTAELVNSVKSYAAANYEKDGWDLVIETMVDADIEKVVSTSKTERGAIYAMSRHIRPSANYRAEIQAEAF